METLSGTLLGTMLALAATLLGLAILVQVFQEMWKFVRSSKSKAYDIALVDFLGPWARQIVRPGALPAMQVRGPGQLLRLRPAGRLLPVGREDLVEALERTAPPWHGRTLKALRLESELQGGTAGASPAWSRFLAELASVGKGSPGYQTAVEVQRFLAGWSGHTPFDAAALLTAFRYHFLPHVVNAERNYSHLMRNFEYAYRRRNLRQTFTVALLMTLGFNLPADRLYRRASALSPEQAVAMAERTMALYAKAAADTAVPDSVVRDRERRMDELRRRAVEIARASGAPLDYVIDATLVRDLWRRGPRGIARYVLGCLLTALLVSFGAPFWNDLAGSLLRLQKGRAAPRGEV